jgi:hypothetical protein
MAVAVGNSICSAVDVNYCKYVLTRIFTKNAIPLVKLEPNNSTKCKHAKYQPTSAKGKSLFALAVSNFGGVTV